jgi:hypothetical protein
VLIASNLPPIVFKFPKSISIEKFRICKSPSICSSEPNEKFSSQALICKKPTFFNFPKSFMLLFKDKPPPILSKLDKDSILSLKVNSSPTYFTLPKFFMF